MKKEKKNKSLIIFLLFILAIISKIFQYNFLPVSYFSDSTYILNLMSNNIETKGTAFWVTAEFYNLVNIFHLSSIQNWSIFLTVVFSIIIALELNKKEDDYSLLEVVFILSSFVLLNIFVFNLSKDIIQLIIFMIIYYFIDKSKLTIKKKIICISIVLILESLFFRPYYIIVCFGFIISFIFLNRYIKKVKDSNILGFFIKILFVFFVILNISSVVFPSQYNKLVNARETVTNILSANTEIRNIIPNSYIANYIVSGIRILFPIELSFKGITYIPFVVYQLMITMVYFKSIKKVDKDNVLLVSLLTGYNLGAFVFEPDFGSVVRHESVLFLFYLDLLIINRKRRIQDENEKKIMYNDN